MKRFWVIPVTAIVLFSSCIFNDNDIDKESLILATVDGKTISAAQMDSIASERHTVIRQGTDLDSLKMLLLDSLVDLRLVDIRVDSVAGELENDRKFLNKRREELAGTVLRIMYQGEISNKVTIDSADIVADYEAKKDEYVEPAQVKASHILVKIPPPDTLKNNDPDLMEKIKIENTAETLKRAQAVYDRAVAGENWDSLAVKYSQDVTNNMKGGDLGYFSRGKMVPAFDSAAFSGSPGDIVGPVETIYGFHIIRINDYKPETQLELNEDLTAKIERRLRGLAEKARADAFVDSLKAQATYQFNEEVLAQEDSLVDIEEWVMIVDATDTVFEDILKNSFYKYLRREGKKEWQVEDKKNMLQEIAVNSLLRASASKLGYYDDPKTRESSEHITLREAGIIIKNMLRNLEYQPTAEEVENYYNDNFETHYKVEKPLHVQHIIFEKPELAAVIRDSLVNGADFKKMALEYYPGEKEIREVAYDLGFISHEELGQEFFDQVNKLEVNQISEPFRTEWGLHVVKLVERRTDKKLDQVRPGIRRALIDAMDKQNKKGYLAQWRKLATIEVDEKKLNKYEFDDSLKAVEITPES